MSNSKMSNSTFKKWAIGGGVLLGVAAAGVFAGAFYNALNQEDKKSRRMINSKRESEEEIFSLITKNSTSAPRKTSEQASEQNSDSEKGEETDYYSSCSDYCTANESGNDTEYLSSGGSEYSTTKESFSEDGESDTEGRKKRKKRGGKRPGRRRQGRGVENIFELADGLMHGSDDERHSAYEFLSRHQSEFATQPDFLWRFARAHQIQAVRHGAALDMNAKEKFIMDGLNYAKKAVEIDEDNGDAHKWLAILIGMKSELDFVPMTEKIKNTVVFQEHLQKAISLKPLDYSLYYVFGRFKFELAGLTWAQRKVAETMFGKIPPFRFEDAIRDCLKAEELSPHSFKENKLLLAKCHIRTGNYQTAVRYLENAKEIPSRTMEERANDKEIEQLLMKYWRYRQ